MYSVTSTEAPSADANPSRRGAPEGTSGEVVSVDSTAGGAVSTPEQRASASPSQPSALKLHSASRPGVVGAGASSDSASSVLNRRTSSTSTPPAESAGW